MKFSIKHTNLNVFDLEKSLEFYTKALGLTEIKRHKPDDDSFELVFLSDDEGVHQIELTWLRDRETPYDLGDNEIHIAFVVDDYDAAFKLHKEMDCVCYENPAMGIYFIEDPDGYWLEIIPTK